ncbi:hypothetical protein [Cohaesibacter gelatinilyticus]|uniref:Uncharacterized protein n=1 Tax=Cohaesibacter gelatinilyticus TaxID=372072 RepID=A0A285PJ22_9HYPH|nr:hypothetical protein [Cohaesibacter gelatinilyticus]SNZ21730.1 hypothetical protein SAMN06265368_4855 [Cohaesibacter gelatinilyticus]
MPTTTNADRHRVNLHPQEDPILCLIEFWEEGSDYYVRAVVDTDDYTYEGNVYTRSQIDVLLPKSSGQQSSAALEASNINRVPGQLVLSAERRVNVRFIVVNTELDTTLIDTKTHFFAQTKTVTVETVAFELSSKLDLAEPVQSKAVTKSEFPALWL